MADLPRQFIACGDLIALILKSDCNWIMTSIENSFKCNEYLKISFLKSFIGWRMKERWSIKWRFVYWGSDSLRLWRVDSEQPYLLRIWYKICDLKELNFIKSIFHRALACFKWSKNKGEIAIWVTKCPTTLIRITSLLYCSFFCDFDYSLNIFMYLSY